MSWLWGWNGTFVKFLTPTNAEWRVWSARKNCTLVQETHKNKKAFKINAKTENNRSLATCFLTFFISEIVPRVNTCMSLAAWGLFMGYCSLTGGLSLLSFLPSMKCGGWEIVTSCARRLGQWRKKKGFTNKSVVFCERVQKQKQKKIEKIQRYSLTHECRKWAFVLLCNAPAVKNENQSLPPLSMDARSILLLRKRICTCEFSFGLHLWPRPLATWRIRLRYYEIRSWSLPITFHFTFSVNQ